MPLNMGTVDDTEAAALLALDEVRVREFLAELESGGIIGPAGLHEHLEPVEDRSLDGGAELARCEFDLGLLQSLESDLHVTDRARERLREGRYGRYATCGGPIGSDRLRILPTAERCVEPA